MNPNYCRPATGTASANCRPGTRTEVSSIYRARTSTWEEAISQIPPSMGTDPIRRVRWELSRELLGSLRLRRRSERRYRTQALQSRA